jgi:hypothetical protein
MLSSSLRNLTPQSIARLCASSQIEFGRRERFAQNRLWRQVGEGGAFLFDSLLD